MRAPRALLLYVVVCCLLFLACLVGVQRVERTVHAVEARLESTLHGKREKSKPRSLSKRALFINQKKQTSRRVHAEKLLRDMGFVAERIEPIRADTPWQSLSATHRFCVQLIASDKDAGYVCIFEDDVDLTPSVARVHATSYIEAGLRQLSDASPGHMEFVKLGACMDEQQVPLCTSAHCQSWCTHAYMLTPQMAVQLLSTPAEEWLNKHSDFAYLHIAPSPPLIGHEFRYDATHPGWRGLFFQARLAPWYERGMSETSHDYADRDDA